MKVLLITLGSAGDVHPFIAMGAALKERGHAVTLVTSRYFEDLVRGAGLDFIGLGEREDFEAHLKDPDFWVPRKGIRLLVEKVIVPAVPEIYGIIERFADRDTVVAASTLALGARVAQEKLKIPLATVHLQPYILLSLVDPPVSPLLNPPSWLPRPFLRGAWSLFEGLSDRLLGGEIRRFRGKLGLPPVRGIFTRWINSPLKVVGLFPEWFGPPAADWPGETELTGFLLFDRSARQPPAAEVENFLQSGDPPLVFTPGTAMAHGGDFFRAAAEASRLLGKRAVFLSGHREHLPSPLPPGVTHFNYVPFSLLFPRCAAVVHHGGIGTSAQALAAGVPQLALPMNFDQFDNAARLVRLGVGRSLKMRKGTGRCMAALLTDLIDSVEVRNCCQELAALIDPASSLRKACRIIERLTLSVEGPLSGGSQSR